MKDPRNKRLWAAFRAFEQRGGDFRSLQLVETRADLALRSGPAASTAVNAALDQSRSEQSRGTAPAGGPGKVSTPGTASNQPGTGAGFTAGDLAEYAALEARAVSRATLEESEAAAASEEMKKKGEKKKGKPRIKGAFGIDDSEHFFELPEDQW